MLSFAIRLPRKCLLSNALGARLLVALAGGALPTRRSQALGASSAATAQLTLF